MPYSQVAQSVGKPGQTSGAATEKEESRESLALDAQVLEKKGSARNKPDLTTLRV